MLAFRPFSVVTTARRHVTTNVNSNTRSVLNSHVDPAHLSEKEKALQPFVCHIYSHEDYSKNEEIISSMWKFLHSGTEGKEQVFHYLVTSVHNEKLPGRLRDTLYEMLQGLSKAKVLHNLNIGAVGFVLPEYLEELDFGQPHPRFE